MPLLVAKEGGKKKIERERAMNLGLGVARIKDQVRPKAFKREGRDEFNLICMPVGGGFE